MARKPRIHYPGAFYHVILRGNDGQDIFYSKSDRTRIYFLFQEGVERYGHSIHAFCLMTNHIHMVIQVSDIPLAKIVQNISFRYTRYINKRKNRIGHLFQGRYKAILIDADCYLLELVRYIHNNPLRAGLASQPEQYQWSSHRAYIGQQEIGWLITDFVLLQFADNKKTALKKFHLFCLKGSEEIRRQEFHQGTFEDRILGDESFSENTLTKAQEKYVAPVNSERLVNAVCKEYMITKQAIMAPGKHQPGAEARALAAYLALEAGKPTLTKLGKFLQRDPTALSQTASRLRKRLKNDRGLITRMQRIKNILKRKTECQA